MQIIPIRLHGLLDYLSAAMLISAPWLLGFADGSAAQWVAVAAGAFILIYSLLTRYERGAVPLIPIRAHLALDVATGTALIASPWVFGFADHILWPHLAFGLLSLAVPALTRRA
ncbi:SPW repeat protein [Plastorhodobacter daqingensis]|uniref:SPW repeat protein n=1 Tax=Plastorhodobacter daqingensis TaxID=1387281 RepID=A0ABW2UFJ6_9RHOB